MTAPSMAIVPPAHAAPAHSDVRSTLHPETGVHDAMRYGLRSLRDETAAASSHPIQNRLEQWDETQRNWKLTMQRNTFGLGAPMRTMMERHFVSQVRALSPHADAAAAGPPHGQSAPGRARWSRRDARPGGLFAWYVVLLIEAVRMNASRDLHATMERRLGV